MKIRCSVCGSENILMDGDLGWNPETNDWEIVEVYPETATCLDCGEQGEPMEIDDENEALFDEEMPLDPIIDACDDTPATDQKVTTDIEEADCDVLDEEREIWNSIRM